MSNEEKVPDFSIVYISENDPDLQYELVVNLQSFIDHSGSAKAGAQAAWNALHQLIENLDRHPVRQKNGRAARIYVTVM